MINMEYCRWENNHIAMGELLDGMNEAGAGEDLRAYYNDLSETEQRSMRGFFNDVITLLEDSGAIVDTDGIPEEIMEGEQK